MPQPAFKPIAVGKLSLGNVVDSVILFLLACAVLLLAMDRGINLYDEGIILVDASRVLNGDVIHRDFYALYGPGQYYIVAALFKLFGQSVLVERFWDTGIRAGAVVLVYLIGCLTSGRVLAALAAMLCIPWLAAFRVYGYPLFPALDAALGCLLFMLPVLQGRTEARFRYLSGLCAGLACLFRYDTGLVIAATVGTTAAAFALRSTRPLATLPARLVQASWVFVAGFATVAIPLALVYAAAGAMPGFIFDFLVFPPAHYAATRSLPFPGLSAIRSLPLEAGVYLPLLICTVACITAAWPRAQQTRVPAVGERDAFRWTLLGLMVLTTLALYAKGLVRTSAIHMAMGIVASFTVLGALAAAWPGLRFLSRLLTAAAMLASVGATAAAVNEASKTMRKNFAWHWNDTANGGCHVAAALAHMRCIIVPGEDLAVAAYLHDRMPPGARLFIGTGRHDKIFVNDISLYFQTRTQPATHWHQFDPGLQTSVAIQQDMVRELETQKLPYIVIDTRFDGIIERNDSAYSSGVTILDGYIASHYEVDRQFGPLTVLKRRPEPAGRS